MTDLSLADILEAVGRCLRSESGSAMTEFVMFLPVWVIIFAGIVDLADLGHEATAVRLKAQSKLWKKAVKVSGSGLGMHSSPQTAFANGVAQGGANIQSIAGASQAITGHWGESFLMTKPSEMILGRMPGVKVKKQYNPPSKATFQPTKVLEAGGSQMGTDYPLTMTSDSTAANAQSMGNSRGVGPKIAKIGASSGLIHSVGAGIRYGQVQVGGNALQKTINFNLGGSLTIRGDLDVLVPPSPIKKSGWYNLKTMGLARAMAEGYNAYSEMMNYNQDSTKRPWNGGSQQSNRYTQQASSAQQRANNAQESSNEQKRKKCNNMGWNIPKSGSTGSQQGPGGGMSNQESARAQRHGQRCDRCMNMGFNGPGDHQNASTPRQECRNMTNGGFNSKGTFRDAKNDGYCNKGPWQQHKRHERCMNSCNTCDACCPNCSGCGPNAPPSCTPPTCSNCCSNCPSDQAPRSSPSGGC